MMNKVLIKFLMSILLILMIVSIVIFNISYFIGSPIVIYRLNDQKALETMSKSNNLSDCVLISRFADDQVYYVAQCQNTYHYFDTTGKLLASRLVSSLNIEHIVTLYQSEYQFNTSDIKLGYYKERPIYLIKTVEGELLIDYDEYTVLRYYKRG